MTLLRGMVAAELVLDKAFVPSELRLIDPISLEWREAKPGVYRPIQKPAGANTEIDLNIPTFFTSRFHQNPTNIYTFRTDKRRVGNECFSTCRSRGSPYH